MSPEKTGGISGIIAVGASDCGADNAVADGQEKIGDVSAPIVSGLVHDGVIAAVLGGSEEDGVDGSEPCALATTAASAGKFKY